MMAGVLRVISNRIALYHLPFYFPTFFQELRHIMPVPSVLHRYRCISHNMHDFL
jgi:hypothetical protein